jgi:hypothetical protein
MRWKRSCRRMAVEGGTQGRTVNESGDVGFVSRRARPSLSAIRRWPSRDARAWTRRIVARLCEDESIDAVVAIGSAVRGAGHARSDVDLLVVFRGAEPPDVSERHIEVDVRSIPRERLESSIAEGHDLLGSALRFGVPVCERGGYWTELASRWNGRLPFPAPAVAAERARRAERLTRDLLDMGDQDAALEQSVTYFTHLSRERLLRAGVYPASRPELPAQLRAIGEERLAATFEAALAGRLTASELLQACQLPHLPAPA